MHAKPLAACRIFYLEDDYFTAADTRETLTAAGAEVSLCGTVPRALELLERAQFDAALLDFNLAGETSIPVARTLRQANVPVVFLTGHTRDILPEDLSSSALLTKPTDGTMVVRELEHQLRLSGSHKGPAGCDHSPFDASDYDRKVGARWLAEAPPLLETTACGRSDEDRERAEGLVQAMHAARRLIYPAEDLDVG